MNNPMFNLIQMLQSGQNPQALVNQMMNNNPNFRMMMNQVQSSGMSTKDYAMNYARQNNIDINPMINMLKQRGIRL